MPKHNNLFNTKVVKINFLFQNMIFFYNYFKHDKFFKDLKFIFIIYSIHANENKDTL